MDKDLLKATLNQILVESKITIITDQIFQQIITAFLDYESGNLVRDLMGMGFETDEGTDMKIEEVKSLLRKQFIYKLLLQVMQKEVNRSLVQTLTCH